MRALPARDHPGAVAVAGDPVEHRLDRRGQRNDARSRLRVAQSQLAPRRVDVVPPQTHDLVLAAPGQHQQAKRRDRRRPRRAVRLRFLQHPAELPILVRREEPLAPDLPVTAHRPARVPPRRDQLQRLGHVEHPRQDLNRRVRRLRRLAQPVVELRDPRPVDHAYGQLAKLGQDVRLDRVAVGRPDLLPTVHLHMALHVALRQPRHRELGLGRRRERLQPPLDAVDDPSGPLAGLVGHQLSVAPERDTLRPVRAARLHDEDLSARGMDPEAEALEVAVPEHGVLAGDGEGVDGALGELRGSIGHHGLRRLGFPAESVRSRGDGCVGFSD